MKTRLLDYMRDNIAMLFAALVILACIALGLIPDEAAAALGAAGTLKMTRRMPSFEGVAANQTATLRLPIGFTYHQLYIAYGGTFTLAQMTEIRVIMNGQVVHRYAGGDLLDSYNQFQGRAAASGILCIDFDRYNLRTRAGEEVTSVGTGFPQDPTPLTTFALEIDIGGATGPTLEAWAVQSVPAPLGLIRKFRTFQGYAPSAAGDFEISDLPRGDLINQMFFGESANNIDRLRVQRDNFTVFDRTDALNTLIQNDGVRDPADFTGFVYDPTEAGNGAEGLVTRNVADLRFILTVSGAMSITLGVDYIGGLSA